MDKNKSGNNAMAGGFFIAFGILIGLIVGIATNEISMGMFGGFIVGTIIAIAIWLFDSKKA